MQGQRQNLVQQQRLNLSPQLVQSIKLMGMPFADLRERILEEVDKNPALEVVSDPFGRSDTPVRSMEPAGVRVSSRSPNELAADEHRDFIEGALAREETLQEHLLSQLGELKLEANERSLAELVIQNLDRDGFHESPPAELTGAGDSALLSSALKTVQSLDPAGCAAAGFQESLAIQARLLERSLSDSLPGETGFRRSALAKAADILENHFDLLGKGRPENLVKAAAARDSGLGFRLDLAEAEEIFDIIRHLDPFPGRRFSSDPGAYIVPDVIVRKTEDNYTVTINDEVIPVLGVSPFFMELEKGGDSGADKAARDFTREAVKEAQWFMNSLSRRNHTILKLARALVVFQCDFFAYGPARLAPLRMKDIAEEIGMHEATVSRAANGKYLQCEWGLFELKYFFSNQVGSTPRSGEAYTAGRFSKEGVKETVRQIIESAQGPLSDQKIVDQLALRGIKLARRTVAKYRSELDIRSSFER